MKKLDCVHGLWGVENALDMCPRLNAIAIVDNGYYINRMNFDALDWNGVSNS